MVLHNTESEADLDYDCDYDCGFRHIVESDNLHDHDHYNGFFPHRGSVSSHHDNVLAGSYSHYRTVATGLGRASWANSFRRLLDRDVGFLRDLWISIVSTDTYETIYPTIDYRAATAGILVQMSFGIGCQAARASTADHHTFQPRGCVVGMFVGDAFMVLVGKTRKRSEYVRLRNEVSLKDELI